MADQTKPKAKPIKPFKTTWIILLSYFRELRLHAKFQLPSLCLSCININMVEEEEKIISRRNEDTAQFELS